VSVAQDYTTFDASRSMVIGTGLQGGWAGAALPLTVYAFDTEGFPLPVGGRVLLTLLTKLNGGAPALEVATAWHDAGDGYVANPSKPPPP
jgi:hypothetical protein